MNSVLGGSHTGWIWNGSEIRGLGTNQLRLVVFFPIIYKVLYILGGDRRISEPSTVL